MHIYIKILIYNKTKIIIHIYIKAIRNFLTRLLLLVLYKHVYTIHKEKKLYNISKN